MSLTGKHVLSSDLFEREELERLFAPADLLTPVARGRQVARVLEGAVMASLSFEARTRTGLSCESAFLRLGGGVTTSTGAEIMSIAKGESLADTSRVVGDLAADLNRGPRLAIFRQTDAGIPMRMALFASVLGAAEAVPEALRPATFYRPEYTRPDDAPFYRNTAP